MTDEEETINWINERKKGSDLMSKLLSKNEQLEKENAELKAKLNGALDICNIPEFRISDLEKKNEQLNRDKTELVNSVTELKIKVTELEKQIEKMKCLLKENNIDCEKM